MKNFYDFNFRLLLHKQGRKRPLDTPQRMMERERKVEGERGERDREK